MEIENIKRQEYRKGNSLRISIVSMLKNRVAKRQNCGEMEYVKGEIVSIHVKSYAGKKKINNLLSFGYDGVYRDNLCLR